MILDSEQQTVTVLRDPKLPSLQNVLDASYMREIFQRHYFSCSRNENEPEKSAVCDILLKRYRPRKRCTVTYSVSSFQQAEPRIFVAHIHRTQSREQQENLFNTTKAKFIQNLGMWLWESANDPQLAGLSHFRGLTGILAVLPDRVRTECAKEQRPLTVQAHSLNYVPLQRSTLRLDIGNTYKDLCPTVVAKISADGIGKRVFDVMEQLWAEQSSRVVAYRVVEPLEFDAARQILWQRWNPGQSFVQFAKRAGLVCASRLAAQGLADLHQTTMQGLPTRTLSQDVQKLQERADVLENFHDSLRNKLSGILLCFKETGCFSQPFKAVPIHGDFNPSQILFHNDEPVFLDFEACALGDPLSDVGHFIGGLYRLAVSGAFSFQEVKSAETNFCQIYRDRVPWPISHTRLHHHIALAFVCRRAHRALRELEEGTIPKIHLYLNYAREYLQACREGQT